MRIYDPRIGKFLSVDPLTAKYPFFTPYQFAGNDPIKYIDMDGAEKYDPNAPQPSGIKPITKSTILGGLANDRQINIRSYSLVGVNNRNGKDYWIARYN